MASNSSYVPIEGDSSGPSTPVQGARDPKIESLKQHVDQVSNIMSENIDKIVQRGSNLNYLEDRSEMLSSSANEFRIGARRVTRKMWWQNMKINIIIGSVAIIILIIIIWQLAK